MLIEKLRSATSLPRADNDPAHLPAGLGELRISESLHAPPVRCSVLILFMVSRGMGRRLSQVKTGSRTCLGPTRDFQEGRNLPTTMRAQAPDPCPRRTIYAVLQQRTPILLRRRSPCQEYV